MRLSIDFHPIGARQHWPRIPGFLQRFGAPILLVVGIIALISGALLLASLTGGSSTPSAEVESPAPVVAPATDVDPQALLTSLTRSGVGEGLRTLELTFAPPEFYTAIGQDAPVPASAPPSGVVLLREEVHEGELGGISSIFMVGPGGERIAPYETTILTDGEHHRSARLLFELPDETQAALTDASGSELTFVAPQADGTVLRSSTFTWALPIDLGVAPAEAPDLAATTAAAEISLTDMSNALQRDIKGVSSAGVSDIEVTATFATVDYARIALPASLAERFRPGQSAVFIVSETTHLTELPGDPVAVTLLAGGDELTPALVEPRVTSPHHRVTVFQFAATPEELETAGAMALQFPDGQSLEWALPISYENTANSPFGIGWGTILAMMAGLVAAMWPCLFQLTAFFIPALAGVSMQEARGQATFGTQLRVFKAALYFVLGFTLVYTAAGAMIGLAAGQLNSAEDFARFQRYLGIGGGIIVLVLAARIAARARAPLVCRMPVLSGMADKPGGGSPLELMFAGLAFATGCMTCFGAAMVITMVIYVGLNGSMFFGAMVMFLFSVGMGVPLVLAAIAMAKVLPMITRLERMVPYMAMASSVLMVGFAILLITGNYMILSEWIYDVFGAPTVG